MKNAMLKTRVFSRYLWALCSILFVGCGSSPVRDCNDVQAHIVSNLGTITDWQDWCQYILDYEQIEEATGISAYHGLYDKLSGSHPLVGGGIAMSSLLILNHQFRELGRLGYEWEIQSSDARFRETMEFGAWYEIDYTLAIEKRKFEGVMNYVWTGDGAKFASIRTTTTGLGEYLKELLQDRLNPKGSWRYPCG
jgi:hypothetical protein